MKKITRNVASAILVPSMLFVSACATGLETRYDEPTDVCRYARQPLIQTERAFNESILVGAGTHGEDDPDKVVARNKWKGWLSGIPAASHRLLGEGHAGRLDLNESLICTGPG